MAALSSVGAYVPAQRLQAERAAAQAEGRAQRLLSESQQARNQADQWQQRADRLREASSQATDEAVRARQTGESAPAVSQVGRGLTATPPTALRTSENSPASSATTPVANAAASINRYLQVASSTGPVATTGSTSGGGVLDVNA